jgi:hypothetical protein
MPSAEFKASTTHAFRSCFDWLTLLALVHSGGCSRPLESACAIRLFQLADQMVCVTPLGVDALKEMWTIRSAATPDCVLPARYGFILGNLRPRPVYDSCAAPSFPFASS